MTRKLDAMIRRWAPRASLVCVAPRGVTSTGRRLFSVTVLDGRGHPLRGLELVAGSDVLITNALTRHYPSAPWDQPLRYRLGRGDVAGALLPAVGDAAAGTPLSRPRR